MQAPAHSAWKPSGLVTLCTDFGLCDPYAGVVHGVIHAAQPGLTVVDLTHGVPPQDVATGAFFVAHSFRYFPAGTVHVAVVDPGVGSSRRCLVVREAGHVLIGPDNGVLGAALTSASEVRALDVERFALPGRSRTFHGRDVFAPAAARIAGGLAPEACGELVSDPVRLAAARPELDADGALVGRVLFADRFGNVVTSVAADDLGAAKDWEAQVGAVRMPLHATYAEGRPGELFALVNSYGCLELAVAGGDARERLALAPGDRVVFRRR